MERYGLAYTFGRSRQAEKITDIASPKTSRYYLGNIPPCTPLCHSLGNLSWPAIAAIPVLTSLLSTARLEGLIHLLHTYNSLECIEPAHTAFRNYL